MSVRDQQIEDELKNISVTKDAYELWLNNDVTRMFRLMIEQDYQEVTQKLLFHETIEKIAISEVERRSMANVLVNVLEWTPDFGDQQ